MITINNSNIFDETIANLKKTESDSNVFSMIDGLTLLNNDLIIGGYLSKLSKKSNDIFRTVKRAAGDLQDTGETLSIIENNLSGVNDLPGEDSTIIDIK